MMRQSIVTEKRKKIAAFTLIELLVTLSIMAVMAAMLFPFIQNYQYRAKTASTFNSLKIMQDSMGRYTQMNDDFDPKSWGGATPLSGPWTYFTNATVTNLVAFCARTGDGSYGDRIISDITTVSSNQVIKLTPELQQHDYILFYCAGPASAPNTIALTNITFFPVFYNIDEPNDSTTNGDFSTKNDYINRHGDRVNNAKHAAFPTDGNYIISLFQ